MAASRLFLDDLHFRTSSRLLEGRAEADDALVEADANQLAFARTFSLFHRVLWALCASYLFSCEFSRLYCSGQTIAAHFLSKFARFLTQHEQYSLAAKVMSMAVKWNVLWLGPRAKTNGERGARKDFVCFCFEFLLQQPCRFAKLL